VRRKAPVVQIVLNNESLDFVNIELQEAGVVPFGVDFKNGARTAGKRKKRRPGRSGRHIGLYERDPRHRTQPFALLSDLSD
jgi:hypothetical protein